MAAGERAMPRTFRHFNPRRTVRVTQPRHQARIRPPSALKVHSLPHPITAPIIVRHSLRLRSSMEGEIQVGTRNLNFIKMVDFLSSGQGNEGQQKQFSAVQLILATR
ncbi:hypothetical protein RUM43_004498 [Polyplax serrata]|uniref:Uncharacterized protein n=1 Tax=Polyplax serrata TaxID=468196 RepID=A0AAN8SDA0_POLSC